MVIHNIPASVRKEVRCCLAVKMLAILFRGEKRAIRAVYKLMSDYFHGTKVICSHLDMLMKADGVYKPMFINAATTTTTTDNSVNSNNNMMSLNTVMFVLPQEYILGKHITKASLENRTAKREGGLASGRMLHEVGLSAMANMRKALALLVMMSEVTALTPDGVEYKSGISEEEVRLKLLQAMYGA